MIKKEYIELIQQELCGGAMTPDNLKKYDHRIIAARCNETYKLMLNEIYLTTKRKRDYSIFDLYCKSFIVDIKRDDASERYYSTLPKAIVSMPLEVVVRKISPIKDHAVSFIPITTNDIEVLTKLPVGNIPGIYFYFENDRIYYWHLPIEFNDHTVNMRLVTNFSDYDEKETINTPTGTMGTMFDRVVASLRGVQMTPEKQINDNQSTNVSRK
jgi:hypothetical protein